MLKGIVVKPLKRFFDERGSFTELLRADWNEILGQDQIVQANFSVSHPAIVRAWHKHLRGQVDYFLALKGSLKICAYEDESQELDEIISTDQNLQIVRVPGHYWHGFKVIGNETAFLLYFTTKSYDYKNPDEQRRPWNDSTIIPKLVNGKKDDPRTGKPWDWFATPYK
jgi:dTDP-4-dehydrorhamnose 3,5-epimerase